MSYRITNQNLGTTIIVGELPPGIHVGVTDIGPSWDNQTPPKLIVEELGFDARRVASAIGSMGYGDAAVEAGIAYAAERSADSDNDAFCLAVSRILYSDRQLAEGEVFDGDIDELDGGDEEAA